MNGAFTELSVCEFHAEELNKNMLMDMISLLTAPFAEDLEKVKKEIMNIPEAKMKEKACPECYELLRTFIHPMLNSIHKTYHVAKPEPNGDTKRKLVQLNQRLVKAIQNQKFEDAAKLRDQIRQITEKDNG